MSILAEASRKGLSPADSSCCHYLEVADNNFSQDRNIASRASNEALHNAKV